VKKIELVPEDTQKAIAAAYQAGKKLRDIEAEHGVTRSQVYWVLGQRHVEPSRTKPKSRLDDGNPLTLERLYEILQAQDERLQAYDKLINHISAQVETLGECLVDDMPTGQVCAVRVRIAELQSELTAFEDDGL
jgi:transposase-like protein